MNTVGAEIVLMFFAAAIACIVWILVNGSLRRQHLKQMTEFNGRLIERIGSVKDFSDFLQSDAGAKFMGSLTVERGSVGPRERILRAAQTGIVFTALGLGFLLLGYSYSLDGRVFVVVGVIALSLGVGFMISAGASYSLSKAMGILDRNGGK